MTGEIPGSRQAGLDDLDRRLIELLESDPRMTHTDLAARLGVSRPTVAAMLQSLLDNRVIQTVCRPNHKALGYRNSIAFCINTAPGSLLDVANEMASLDHLQYVALCSGRFEILSWGVFKDPDEILDFLSARLGRVRGLSRCETLMCQQLKTAPVPSSHIHDFPMGTSEAPLADLDIALIEGLRENCRETATALAAKLHSTRPTINRRMRRLLDEGIMRFSVVVNPLATGFRAVACVGLRVSPALIKDVGEALVSNRSIHTVSLCTGRYDVMAWVVFREQEDLMNILTTEIGGTPGITSMETLTNLRIIRA